jgi:hypothetical protein
MVLLPCAALLLGCSFAATTEAESPSTFPGLQDNHSGLALLALVLSAASALAALLVLIESSAQLRLLRALVGLVCGLLLAVAAYRAATLAPMLACWEHSSVAQQPDGSYACYD